MGLRKSELTKSMIVQIRKKVFVQVVDVRETREGCPLLTVETEENGDSKSTNERGPSLVVSLGLSCRYKRCSLCLSCFTRSSAKYFFLQLIQFQFLCLQRTASWAGSCAGSPVFSMCLYLTYTSKIVDLCIPKKT